MAIDSMLTVVGIIIALVVQSWAFLRWLNRELESRDQSLADAVRDRVREIGAVTGKIEAVRDHHRTEIARVDRDLSALRERLAQMPSRKDMEDIIRDRIAPMELEVRGLVIHLARLGLHESQSAILKSREQWNQP